MFAEKLTVLLYTPRLWVEILAHLRLSQRTCQTFSVPTAHRSGTVTCVPCTKTKDSVDSFVYSGNLFPSSAVRNTLGSLQTAHYRQYTAPRFGFDSRETGVPLTWCRYNFAKKMYREILVPQLKKNTLYFAMLAVNYGQVLVCNTHSSSMPETWKAKKKGG